MTLSEALTEPSPGGTCRVCGHALAQGSLRCSHCGAVYGEPNRCPHCRAIAGIDLRGTDTVCRVCGGARVAAHDPSVLRTGREIPLLLSSERARRRTSMARVGAVVALAFSALVLLLALGVLGFAVDLAVLALGGVVLGAVPLVTGLLLLRGATRAEKERAQLLRQAKLIVAADVLSTYGGHIEPSLLARTLDVPLAEAELLLAELSISDWLGPGSTPAADALLHKPRVGEVTEQRTVLREPQSAHEPSTTPLPPQQRR